MIKFATFNVSMEATNPAYLSTQLQNQDVLTKALQNGEHPHAKNIAHIIQQIQPDIILLNEFDFIKNTTLGIQAFINNYLNQPQSNALSIDYPYHFIAPVNSGLPVPHHSQINRLTHFGFGQYPGQYGMALLSKWPIDYGQVRTFQHFLWRDMPNNLMPQNKDQTSWYNEHETNIMRLSSKSHWDIPVKIHGQTIHVLACHPTPPVFDGDEQRNRRRNHDEIRFWSDYIKAEHDSYHYDDKGVKGALNANEAFVIMGDLNACANEGDSWPNTITNLINQNRMLRHPTPSSKGAKEHSPDNEFAEFHTACWRMRADYILPSDNFTYHKGGVFWPTKKNAKHYLVQGRLHSSDHRLVWLTLSLNQ